MSSLRPARDSDAQDLFGLLSLCFAEYPGCYVDPHDDLPDIVKPGHWNERRGKNGKPLGGEFWVLEDERGRVCACVALDFPGELASEVASGSHEANSINSKTAELHRLYVRPDCRRRGIAARLVAHVETAAREQSATRIVLWSDTRFEDAHRLYEKCGYTRLTGVPRELGDLSQSREYGFVKSLIGK
ncbi:MAG TPA: GNAT family N-acetyltransferase [Rhabdaerophilum sp.]|nr:GNAT family N-acetyltransferase [Rhabdaerophilum sp.]